METRIHPIPFARIGAARCVRLLWILLVACWLAAAPLAPAVAQSPGEKGEQGEKRDAPLVKGFHTETRTILGGMTRNEEALQLAESLPKPDRVVLEPTGAAAETQAFVVFEPCEPKVPFRDALVSWNCDVPKGAGIVVELRVARTEGGGDWSTWMRVGAWGDVVESTGETVQTTCPGGGIEQGIFLGELEFTRVQARLRAFASSATPQREIVATRVCLALRNRTRESEDKAPESAKELSLKVPSLSLSAARADASGLAGSMAILLATRDVDAPVKKVTELTLGSGGELPGARGVQAAHVLGAPGNLKSISSWGDVERHLRGGFALAIHVRAAAGELDGAPQNASERRWIVLTGLDGKGGCQTQDPAALGGKGASVTYSRTDLERVWMAHGGTTIVLDPPRKSK